MLPFLNLKKTLSSFRPLSLLGISITLFVFITSSAILLHRIYKKTLIAVPAYGGHVDEGIIGSPRFINPLLAVTQSDLDMTRLVYSGLMREDAEGQIVPDLAESVVESADGLTYTFTLKPDIKFQDGEVITADDIVYTIALVQDETLKSPKKIEWEGVSVTKVDDQTIVFALKQPFARFKKIATIGIIPKHIWKDLSITNIGLSDYNISPIGSGPYKISSVDKKAGIPSQYTLTAFSSGGSNRGYIDSIGIHIYPNTEDVLKALSKGEVTQVAAPGSSRASAIQDSSSLAVLTEPLPRIYGVFFNQSKNQALLSSGLRSALDKSIDRKKIITDALYGYGVPAYSPVPKILQRGDEVAKTYSVEEAQALIIADGWKINQATGLFEKKIGSSVAPLKITITTIGSVPEFEKTAEALKSNWQKLGIQVDIQYYELGDLNQKVIKSRDYEVLLYGTVIKTNSDLYAFWHSSQIKDPGLNLSVYANTKVDKALDTMRGSAKEEELAESTKILTSEIAKDNPALFIYTPEFIYISSKKISGINLSGIISPEDRFNNVSEWYINTENIWSGLKNIELLKKLQDRIH